MKKQCVINFAKGSWYPRGQQRLFRSLLDTGWNNDTCLFDDERQIQAPGHQDCPYGFKPYALRHAAMCGYTNVLWCDASVWAVKNIQPMFDYIDQHGWLFFVNTSTGIFTSDACLEQFEVTRDQAMDITMLMGICMGFNLTHPKTQEFLKRWLFHADNGISFPGSWTNDQQQVSKDPRCKGHRHDQSAASLIAWQLEMDQIIPHETFFEYYQHPRGGLFDGDLSLIRPHTLMVAQGM